jgi:hypothetical protein
MLMGELTQDAVERLARLVGVALGDWRDEHDRWKVYLKAMETPAVRGLLLRAVGSESDDNLAASVVLSHHRADRRGRARGLGEFTPR